MARGGNVDFWSNYQKGQQAAFAEETWDARKRGIEADVGTRELALQQGTEAKAYDDQWNSGWQQIMNNWINQANQPMQTPTDQGSQVSPQRPGNGAKMSMGGGGGGIASMFGGGGGGGGGGNSANANMAI